MWVTPDETHDLIRRHGFTGFIADELADWIARRLSMCFAAGFIGHKELKVDRQDLIRQLMKMGYASHRAVELSGLIADNAPGLYMKGLSRHHERPAHAIQ
jgi:hypothetical protein